MMGPSFRSEPNWSILTNSDALEIIEDIDN